jgi:hypothetical protein
MPSQSYYPTRDGDQLTWFTILQIKIPAYYKALRDFPPLLRLNNSCC